MSFSALRTAFGTITRRALRNGVALPVFQSHTHQNGGQTNFTITPASGTVDTDLMILHGLARWDDASPGIFENSTTDWTQIDFHEDPATSNQSIAHYLFYRQFVTGDTTWSFNTPSLDSGFTIMRITGHDPAAPINAAIMGGALSETTTICPGVVTDINNCLMINLFGRSRVLSGSGITFPPGQTVINSTNFNNMQQAAGWEDFTVGGGTGTRTWMDTGHASERRNAAMILVAPIEGAASLLEFEATTDNLLLEDSSGVIELET